MLVAWSFVELDDVGSTQAVAKDLAAKGAPEGTAVVARSQSSGGGRLGRRWVSPVGGLYMSFVLRPKRLFRPELVTLVSAVAVVQGVRRVTGLTPTIRWPNDVLVNGKKLAGVIAEAQSYRQEITQIIVGVGVNCNAPMTAEAGLEGEATSLFDETSKRVKISEVRRSILDSFSRLYERWGLGDDMVSMWRDHIGTIGKRVSVKLRDGSLFSCVAEEVDEDGNLVVAKRGGTVVVHAEELQWLREL
jgi:BirA family transcriptional regulator, biotin operon repressor / biotin---[acetyl-CoA-carboxylase] ligase